MATPIRVLIVEDSSDDAERQVHELRRVGYDLSWVRAENATEMRAALESGVWDVILADFTLSQFGAVAALELARELGRDVPLVVVSGTSGEEAAVAAMRAGASDFILKQRLDLLGPAVERELRNGPGRVSRWQAEQAARELAAIVQSSDDAITGRTVDGVITSWNPGAERLYGYSAAEAIGKSIGLLIPPELAEDLERISERVGRGERVEPFETVRLRKDGTRVDVSVSVSPVLDAAGRVVGASTISRDVTQKRRAEEHLRQQTRLLQALLDGHRCGGFVAADETG